MSVETALNEFYPVPASELKKATDLECAQHALKKWTMFLPENLEKHGIKRNGFHLMEINREHGIGMGGTETCALCQKHFKAGFVSKSQKCETCPLFKINGNTCCDAQNRHIKCLYDDGRRNPLVMIEVLQELVENLQVE